MFYYYYFLFFFLIFTFLHFSFLQCFQFPTIFPHFQTLLFPARNLNFKARFWVREEERKKKEERRRKKKERADRNRSPSRIARIGPFCYSRAWKPLTPIKRVGRFFYQPRTCGTNSITS